MSQPRKSPIRIAGRSVSSTCQAFFQWFYSSLVLILVCITAFAAYVATLDVIPVPQFLIRELRDELKTRGLVLRMQAISFQPNGRVIVKKPELYSPELGSTLFSAQYAVAKVKPGHLFIGRVVLDELRVSSGELVVPAMLTPSGTPSTAIHSIDLEASLRGEQWRIHHANLAIDALRLSLSGSLKESLLPAPAPKDPDKERLSASELVLKFAPKFLRWRDELKRLSQPRGAIELGIDPSGAQFATLALSAESLVLAPEASAERVLLNASVSEKSTPKLSLSANSLKLPQGVTIGDTRLTTEWPALPTAENWMPPLVQVAVSRISYNELRVPSLVASIEPSRERHAANVQFTLADAPVSLLAAYATDTKQIELEIFAELAPELTAELSPIAKKVSKLDLELTELARLDRPVDLHAKGLVGADFKPISAHAFVQSGPLEIRGAAIERATARAAMRGPQIDVPAIQLRNGLQSGVVTIGYNLETLKRRILVEGDFDPTMINGWFKPWWAAMWEGMEFPEQGMRTYLDSQAIFLQPQTVTVTGLGYGRGLNLRSLPVEDLRLRFFARFHYVDLYDIELLTTDGQQAFGAVQFHMDRDTRDEKDKLTGLWIDAVSTLDVKRAPEIIWEIADDAARILAPYCYQTNPLIEARSASVRHQDLYSYDIDLDVETPNPFAFYGFPFDSLATFVHVGNDTVDIPNAQARLADGIVQLSAFIVGDRISLAADLVSAHFGETLVAANTYFARDGSKTAQTMDEARLLNYGGLIDAGFRGSGFLADPLSYTGDGELEIRDADFGKFRLLGLLSMALEVTPLRFTTLKFNRVDGPFTLDKRYLRFGDTAIEGPVAGIQAEGSYDLATDAIDFKARLFPFRNTRVPLISTIINLPLNIVSNVLEVTISGTFNEPRLRLFNPATEEQIDVDAKQGALREHRPTRK